jgi:SpoVK/Ycf46/Vps4 family AAA+-type ATPase
MTMATAEQLKAMLRSYVEGDRERFLTVSMQVAAHAARRGNTTLAKALRELIDQAKQQPVQPLSRPSVPIARPVGELADLIAVSYPKTRLSDMVLAESPHHSLKRVVIEYRHQTKLRTHSLSARRKLLLVGPPGSGKTMTASALAGELQLPLLAVRLDGLITKFLGESAAKLRQVFDSMSVTCGVYLFDEFDAIGGDRGRPNEVGEIRRVLNSFLQFLEVDESDSIILAATNHLEILDPALFRRFDDVVRYGLPSSKQAEELIRNRLNTFRLDDVVWDDVRQVVQNLSCAEIVQACTEIAKAAVLADRDEATTGDVLIALKERQAIRHH